MNNLTRKITLGTSALALALGGVFTLRSCNQGVLSTEGKSSDAIDFIHVGTYEGRTRELVHEQEVKIDSLSKELEKLSNQNQMLVNKVDSLINSK